MRFTIAPLALLISSGLALSQTDKINFRTLALDNSKFPELWAASSGKAIPLAFSSSQPSAALKADKTNPLRIFKGPLDDKGKPTDMAPALVDLPASPSIMLLAWTEDEKPGFLAVADSFATAKNDDWLVVNKTKKPLTVQIGDAAKALQIEADSHQTIKCTAKVGEGAATTVASQQADGSWKPVYSSYLPIYDNQRGLIVVVEKNGRIRVNYIADPITVQPKSGR